MHVDVNWMVREQQGSLGLFSPGWRGDALGVLCVYSPSAYVHRLAGISLSTEEFEKLVAAIPEIDAQVGRDAKAARESGITRIA